MNRLQKHFVKGIANKIVNVIDNDKLELKKNILSIEDFKAVKDFGIEVNDSRQIVDNMPYVEYELVKVSQRIFERPIANQPFADMLFADPDGSTEESIIYKFIDYKGGFTLNADKGAANSIVSTKHGATPYAIETLSAYLEDMSLREMAVAMAKGYNINERKLRAMYVAFIKTLNTVIFDATDAEGKSGSFQNALKSVDASPATAGDTWANYIIAGTSIKIYEELAEKIADMESNGEKADGQFTPNKLVLPVYHYGLTRNLMANTGFFNGTIKEYLEKMLGLEIVTYAGLKGAGAGGVDRALLINDSPENLFYGLPNPLEIYADQKFDITSNKGTFRTSGLVVINGGAVGAIDGI